MRIAAFALTSLVLAAQSPEHQRIARNLRALCSPSFLGRGNGSPGLDLAAEYVAQTYKRLGLDTTIQRFPFVDRVERTDAWALLGKGDEGGVPLVWGKDVEAIGFSGDASFHAKALVFGGYGLRTGSYDDLAGVSVRGKTVLFARKVPDLPFFRTVPPAERSMVARVQQMEKAGAAAVIFLEDGPAPRLLQREEGPVSFKIPVLSMPASALEPFCGNLLERLARIPTSGQSQARDFSYAPWAFLGLRLRLSRHETTLPNVIARIPGWDPNLRTEHLVLGAHLDHLGTGSRYSHAALGDRNRVHPGADDNASGTALLMELARKLRRHPTRRSILLLHPSGEEEGFLGSTHWIQSPTVALPSVKFMVNFDMVGRLDSSHPHLLLGGLGAPRDAWERAKAFAPKRISVGSDLGIAVGGSDHMSFAKAHIPAFFFFTGLHDDYHRPSDTADRIHVPGLVALGNMAFKVVQDLGNQPTTPPFDPETAQVPPLPSGLPLAHFGLILDPTEHPEGPVLRSVIPGSPADALGLKTDDRVTVMGGRAIHNLADLQKALDSVKPGDPIRVQWLRGTQTMDAETHLGGR